MEDTRVALVTGANKGLGFETSRQLGRMGLMVLMAARNEARGEAAARRLMEEGVKAEFILLDVTDPDHIRQAGRVITERFGRLDVLVNNAGMAHPDEPIFANSVATVSPAVLRKTFDVNFFGLVELTQTLLPLIQQSGAGRIVNVSSVLGSLTIQSYEGPMASVKPFAYDASKAAVNLFTVHLAAALRGTQVKVNSAHPGWVRTDLGGEQAPLSVEEGAETIVRLATLGPGGPSGGFFHLEEELPW